MADTDTATHASEARRARAAASPETLEAQVDQLQSDIRSITETLTRMGTAKIDEARATATSQAQRVVGEAQNEFDNMERQLKQTIRDKPITAVAAALAIGYLVAALTR